jgi:hypothetical protein
MRERGFLEEPITKAEDVIKDHIDKPLIVVAQKNSFARHRECVNIKYLKFPLLILLVLLVLLMSLICFRVMLMIIADKPIRSNGKTISNG